MGWCSGTEIFDDMVALVKNMDIGEHNKELVIKRLIYSLENQDWDCQSDSGYFDYPLVKRVFIKMHPDWFEHE